MNVVTVIWTVVSVAFAALCAAGGGHPPGVILVPFVFGGWLAGAVLAELSWRFGPARPLQRSAWFVATASPLFAAVSAIALWWKDSHYGATTDLREAAWYVALGPVLLVWTLASLWQLRHGGRSMATLLLAASALLVLWLALD